MAKVKICGLTSLEDVMIMNRLQPDYIGMVMGFPKSKRNISEEKAKELIQELSKDIKKVAVMVSPDKEQIQMAERCGFDYIQFHKDISKEAYESATLPLIKAFNVDDMKQKEQYDSMEKIIGYVFDAAEPGSGKAFDWEMMNRLPRDDKMMILAGGLNESNVANAINYLHPDVVDVSSGVEKASGMGKDEGKTRRFIETVRGNVIV